MRPESTGIRRAAQFCTGREPRHHFRERYTSWRAVRAGELGNVIRTEMTSTLSVADADAVRLDEADLPALCRLCLSCTAFYELVEGRPATEATAAEILGPLDSEYAHGVKHVWGVKRGAELIAVAELLQGHPDVRDWYIGLLLIDPEHRRKGLGAQFCAGILNWIGCHGGSTVRLIVQQQNADARSFWERQGFEIEREVLKRSGRRESLAWVLVRRTRGERSGT